MSSFYERVEPLVKKASDAFLERMQRVSLNDSFNRQAAYWERTKLLFVASQLSAKEDGARVRVDSLTKEVNREEFINHLHRLAGESETTVWVTDQEEN